MSGGDHDSDLVAFRAQMRSTESDRGSHQPSWSVRYLNDKIFGLINVILLFTVATMWLTTSTRTAIMLTVALVLWNILYLVTALRKKRSIAETQQKQLNELRKGKPGTK
ncbi:hypothetical protein BTA51_23125 [Hahella sp. CCB-MM4]|uniref:hypothetical protein n=1 Tax=Hahella sp. (strain CCB-MM4) TaxID=1926491 RepID=UPI000B9C4DF2|nr:hypothetical protein [Hahella sp. CCB-MM4]OZG71000.1 hypothetical protein BTA51_23125 [Hahella sp. CCB-MM4]